MMIPKHPQRRSHLPEIVAAFGALALAAPAMSGPPERPVFTPPKAPSYPGDEGVAMQHVAVELGLDRQTLTPGEPATLGVRFRIEETWHLYWHNSGDSGMPIGVTFSAPEGVRIGELQWPAPERYVYGHGSVDYIYEHDVALLASIELDADRDRADPVEITASFELLACKEACVFGMGERTIVIDTDESTPMIEPAWMKKSRARIPGRDQSPLDLRWDGTDLLISAYDPDLRGPISFFPSGPASSLPTNPLDDGTSETGRLRIAYPKDITEAPLVAGVIEIMGRDGPVWIEIETTPPGSARRGETNEPTDTPPKPQSTNHRSGD